MNQLKNGTLLVVIATVVTAILILVTSREEAKSPKVEHEVVTIEKEAPEDVITQVEVENPETEVATAESLISEVSQEAVDEKIEVTEVIAPDGPFKKADAKVDTQVSTEAKDSEVESEAMTAVATISQHAVLNHIVQPIWMDQKLGDFKSIETDGVVFKIMPTSSDGLQGENPNEVVTSKSDKFGTQMISADYNYQQMPMYNGGYYIAPMPSYLMPSMLPAGAGDKK